MYAIAMDGLIAQTTEGQTWLIYGVAAMSLMYIVLRPMLKRRRDPLEKSSPRTSLARQRSLERQMETLLVELSEMARQITAQMDTRAARLEALIRDADQRLAQLRDMPAASASFRLPSTSSPAAPPLELPDRRHSEIYALADQGRPPHEIAMELNRPNGEVELILALRRQAS